jgi:hypothetical protein
MPFLPSFGSWCQTGGSIRAGLRNERAPRHGTIEPDSSGEMADGDSRGSLHLPSGTGIAACSLCSVRRCQRRLVRPSSARRHGRRSRPRHHLSACPPGTGSNPFPAVDSPGSSSRRIVSGPGRFWPTTRIHLCSLTPTGRAPFAIRTAHSRMSRSCLALQPDTGPSDLRTRCR